MSLRSSIRANSRPSLSPCSLASLRASGVGRRPREDAGDLPILIWPRSSVVGVEDVRVARGFALTAAQEFETGFPDLGDDGGEGDGCLPGALAVGALRSR